MIRRVFLDWDQPPLPRAADYLLQRYVRDGDADLSNVILVFPGRRAARRMLELLVEKTEQDYPGLRPPQMVTFDRFPELLYRQKLELADDLTELLVWRQAILQIPADQLKPALTRLPPEDSLSSWIRLCETLRRQHVELAGEALHFGHVFDAMLAGDLTREADRWKTLRRIQSEYLVQMDRLQRWDRQTARLFAVEHSECRTDRDVVLIGTVDTSRIVQRMLDQIADRVTSLICAPEQRADSFDEYGCLRPDDWGHGSVEIPDDVIHIADDPTGQAREVVSRLAAEPGPLRADEVAIGVADESLVPVIAQTLAAADVPSRWPVGSQLKESRPWRLLDAIAAHLATAQNGLPPDFLSLAQLVRHPDVGRYVERELHQRGIPSGTHWLMELDRYQAEHLQPVPGVVLGHGGRRRVVQGILAAVDRLLEMLAPPISSSPRNPGVSARRPVQQQLLFDEQPEQTLHQRLEEPRPLQEWSEGIHRVLALIYADYESGEHVLRDDAVSQCVERLRDLDETLDRIPPEVQPRCSAAQAIPLLLMQIGGDIVPSPPNEQAVDLMGWLELPLDDTPLVLVTGFNEGYVPESATSDVFLPNTVRTRLGLKDNRRRFARDAWAVQTLLNSRRSVCLLAGRQNGDGDPLAPSRLWFTDDARCSASRILTFYQESDSDVSAEAADAVDSESGMSFAGEFYLPPPLLSGRRPEEIAVTHFRDYLACPYRYMLQRELRLKAVQDQPLEMDGLLFGNIIHAVLNRFADTTAAGSSSLGQVEKQLLQLLQDEAAQQFGRQRSATIAVQLQMAEQRLAAFATWQARQVAEGWRLMYSEQKLLCEDFRDSQGRRITLNGRIDRIDQHQQTGQWRVLDYKTSESAKTPRQTHRHKDSWVDLQLPLYQLLVQSLGIDHNVQLGYVNLPGDLKRVGDALADWNKDDLSDALDQARQVAADILDLRLDRMTPSSGSLNDDLGRVCQETVVDRQIPWLATWSGRGASV